VVAAARRFNIFGLKSGLDQKRHGGHRKNSFIEQLGRPAFLESTGNMRGF
jgi:hypothetical protein